jgi:hypothetical protein
MSIDINSFMHSLAKWMVAQIPSGAPLYDGTPRGLWVNKVVEPDPKNSSANSPADPYSVLRITGGPASTNELLEQAQIVCETFSKTGSDPAAAAQSRLLYEALLYPSTDPSNPMRPRVRVDMPYYDFGADVTDGEVNYRVFAFQIISPPAKTAIEQRGRPNHSFKFLAIFGVIPI